jgi:hypothetical protein
LCDKRPGGWSVGKFDLTLQKVFTNTNILTQTKRTKTRN